MSFVVVLVRHCPHRRGGGKSGKTGEGQLNADGSGKWVRWDRGATRFSTLYSSGPARQEVYERVTFDSNTGEKLGVLPRFDTAKNLNDNLPPPVPRDIRSEFFFRATSKVIPSSARTTDTSMAAAAQWRPSLYGRGRGTERC